VWVTTENEETGLNYLCFTETGELSPSIPEPSLAVPCSYQRWKSVPTSPDSRWVLIFCTGIEFAVYSYDTQLQQFLVLGRSTGDENHTLEVVRWLTGTEVILHSNPSWSPLSNAYYVVEVTRSESLEFIVADVYGAPRYYDEPPHLEWMPCEFTLCGPGPREDGLRYYDFTTHEFIVYPYIERANGVGDVIPDGSGDRLYRALNYRDDYPIFTAPAATLIRFNYETLESTEIYTGEVEWVEGFSPDGRYAVLYVGHDNSIGSNLVLAESQGCYSPDGNASLAILDLLDNTIVYEASGSLWDACANNPFRSPYPDNYPLSLIWLDGSIFFIQGLDGDTALLVTLGEAVEIEAEFESVELASLSPDNQRILVWDKFGQVNVYHIATGETIPIIQSLPFDQYTLLVSWQSPDELLIKVVEALDEDRIRELARWRVRVPL
jgi:WD40 repeat protein